MTISNLQLEVRGEISARVSKRAVAPKAFHRVEQNLSRNQALETYPADVPLNSGASQGLDKESDLLEAVVYRFLLSECRMREQYCH
jgi:hypothetical protein